MEYNSFGYEIGNDIAVKVTKNTPANGTLEVSANPVMGGNITVTLTPASGYIVSSFTVNGENKAAGLSENNGVYTLTLSNFLSKELNVNAAFIEKAEVNVTLKFTGIADGTEVTLESASNTYTVTVNNGEAAIEMVKGTYTASAANCHSAEFTVSADGEVAVGLTAFTAQEIMANKYVESGAENFDVSGYEEKKIVFTGTSESYMTLKQRIPANENMMILTRIKAQNTFENDVSFGYVLTGVNGQLICRFTHDVANGNWLIQFTNWTDWGWGGHLLTAEQLALYNGAEGLYFGIARVNEKFCIYIEQNGAMQLVHETNTYAYIANDELKIELVAWGSASGAEYNDFEILTGNLPVTVNMAAAANGTVEVSANPVLGGNITVTLTPDAGYTLSQVTINGTVTEATQNGDAFTVTLNNYVAARTLAVAATFVENTEVNVTLKLDGDGTYPGGKFTAEETKAWATGEGVRVGAGRFNNKWMAFIERTVGGKKVMVKVCERDAGADEWGNRLCTTLKLAGTANAVYEDLLWQVGEGIDMTRLKID